MPLNENEFRCERCLRRRVNDSRLVCEGCNSDASDVCNECDSCWTCAAHDTRHAFGVERCDNCSNCVEGCVCVTCANDACRRRHATAAGVCSVCRKCSARNPYDGDRTCCRCAAPWEFYNPPNGPHFHHGKFKKNKSERFLAAEIEFNHIGALPRDDKLKLMTVVKKWGISVVRDGSVNACELNTAPANGDAFIDQLDEIGAALAAHTYTVDHNCGVHVHVDSRDLNFYDVRKLMYMYRWVEPALYGIVHPKRSTNSYCRPCSESYVHNLDKCAHPKEAKKAFFKNVYGKDPGRDMNRKLLRSQGKGNGTRYNALNMHSWVFRGTIENRMHHGTGKTEVIKNWAMVNGALINYINAKSEGVIRALCPGPHLESPPIRRSVYILKEAVAHTSPKLADWVEERYNLFSAAGANRLPSDT